MRIIDLIDQTAQHPTRRYRRRNLRVVSHAVIHHSATHSGTPAAIARYHVRHNGWPGIAYHYVIAPEGDCCKCQPLARTTWHARGANRKSVGICLVGDFDSALPRAAQMDALLSLLRELRAWRPTLEILGHREVPHTHKSCPGRLFDMHKLRLELSQ